MLKLLVVAPTSDHDDVGEAWVGYQWVRELADRTDLTVLTYHKQGRVPLSRQLPSARVVEWAEPAGFGRFERLNSMLKPAYVPFYVRARRWIKQAVAAGERFDIAHQPVPVAMRYPSPLTGSGIPYVIGPVGGGLDSPPALAEKEGSTPWFVALRNLDRHRIAHDPVLRRSFADAACVIGIAPYVAELLQPIRLRRFEVMSETALASLPPVRPRPATETVRLLFVGRLVRTKGANEAIAAMARLRDLPVELDIVGDGPCRTECEALVQSLDLTERVRLHGSLPREVVEGWYERASVFVFPSYREPGGNVVFEAMGHQLPLVVVDRGGPGAATDDACAIRIRAESSDQIAHDVAQAVRRLVADPILRRTMGEAARRRVESTALWPAKVDSTMALYDEIIGGS